MSCRPGHRPRHEAFEVGNQVAKRHGVFSADVTEAAQEVVGLLLSEEDIARFPAVALVYAETWVRWRRAVADIEARGEVLVGEDGFVKPHPLLPYVDKFARTLLDLSARFGLDPRSEAALARDRADASRLVADLDEVRERGRQARLAAEARGELETSSAPSGAVDDRRMGDGITAAPSGAETGCERPEGDRI